MKDVMDDDMDLFFEKELDFHLTLAGACSKCSIDRAGKCLDSESQQKTLRDS